MELQQLKYFKTVAEIGKISEAAESLFISAPALSTSISRLEKELGYTLFDRTNNKIVLNQQGEIFLKYVTQIFSLLSTAKQELQQSLQNPGPHISLLSIETTFWVSLISAFTSEFPQYTLSCASTSPKKLLEEGFPTQHTFLLASEEDIPSSFVEKLDSIPLFDIITCVMLHKSHPLAHNTTIDLRDIWDEKLFMPSEGIYLYNRLVQLFELYNLPIPKDNSYSYLARQQMAKQNLGISFGTLFIGYNPLSSLSYIPIKDPFGPRIARLYWRKNRQLNRDEERFKDFVKEFYHNQY